MAEFSNSSVFFHNTDPLTSPWPYSVPVGGRSIVSHKDGMVRRRYHEHVLILTLSGEGRVEVGDDTFTAIPQSIVWLDTARRYGHGAKQGGQWAYLWIALAGHGLNRLYEQIALVDDPVLEDVAELQPRFSDIIGKLAEQPSMMDAELSAHVAAIMAVLFNARQSVWTKGGNDPVAKLMRHLRREIDQSWEIEAMADMVGLSPSQLFRRFKALTGTTPISWLRQERMLLAKYLLTGTTDRIASVAHRCGYNDPFHFSRDFKRQHDCTPRDFRLNSR